MVYSVEQEGFFYITILPCHLLHQSWSTGWKKKWFSGSTMRDWSDNPSHHECSLLPQSYIPLLILRYCVWLSSYKIGFERATEYIFNRLFRNFQILWMVWCQKSMILRWNSKITSNLLDFLNCINSILPTKISGIRTVYWLFIVVVFDKCKLY